MLVATVYSYPVTRDDTGETGQYESEVYFDEMELRLMHNKKETIVLRIAEHAKKMAMATGLPLNQGLYYADMDPTVAESVGLPRRFDI